jgi:hypothetical protein
VPTQDLWFIPDGGPGRQYQLDYEGVRIENAGVALSLRMFRKFAAGEVGKEPVHSIFLAISSLAIAQIKRERGADDEAISGFLQKTAERAAACLDMRLPPPIEPAVPKGYVLWLSASDYGSEKALTTTLLRAIG